MPEQISLFDTAPPSAVTAVSVAESVPRKAKRERAAEKVDPAFLARYERVLVTVGRVMPTFGAWDVTAAYARRYARLTDAENKAIGWLYTDMQFRNVIEDAGTGKRLNGNRAPIYRLKRS
jgi:hypothetical protein